MYYLILMYTFQKVISDNQSRLVIICKNFACVCLQSKQAGYTSCNLYESCFIKMKSSIVNAQSEDPP